MAPKKQKPQKMGLGDFLGDQTLGSWADEMEDTPIGGGGASFGGGAGKYVAGGGMGGGGFGSSDRGAGYASMNDRGYAVREELPMPTKPPYTAHLGNLSFDATEGDIRDFFGDCEITNVRIVEDKMEMKPKGFGYAEFGSVDGLKKALDLSGTQFQGRNIRVSVAEPPKDRADGPMKDMSDWTRKGPLPDLPGQRSASGRGFGSSERSGGYRQFEPAPEAGGERGERRRPPPFADDGKVRDFGNWERRGPLSPAPSAAPGGREGGRLRSNDGPEERRRSPAAWGEGQSSDGSRPPRREFQERPAPEPTAAEQDNQWRSKMRPDAPAAKSPLGTPDGSVPSSPAPSHAAPATRPRLNLAKRTVTEDASNTTAAETSSKSNPFGAARPIDTAAREKEIEEKRVLAIRQKKEADDKAREERRAKEAADRADRKESVPATPTAEEGAEGKPRSNFEILRRMEEEGGAPKDDAPDADAEGEIVDDQAVKPKEVVRDPPKSEGAWRRKSNTPAAPAETGTEEMADDGWSTVTKPQKATKGKGRGGAPTGPTRAIAS